MAHRREVNHPSTHNTPAIHGAFSQGNTLNGTVGNYDFSQMQDNSNVKIIRFPKFKPEQPRTLQEIAPTLLQNNMALIKQNGIVLELVGEFMNKINNNKHVHLFVQSVRNILIQHNHNSGQALVPIIDTAFNCGMSGGDGWKCFQKTKRKVKANEIKALNSLQLDCDLQSLLVARLVAKINEKKSTKSTKRYRNNPHDRNSSRSRSRSRHRDDDQCVQGYKQTNDTNKNHKMNELNIWLNQCNLSQYYGNFAQHGFDEEFDLVYTLSEDDLRHIGITKMAHIKKIGIQIARMKKQSNLTEINDENKEEEMKTYDTIMVNNGDENDSNDMVNNGGNKFEIFYDEDGVPHIIFNDCDKEITMEKLRQKSIEKKEKCKKRTGCVISPMQTVKGDGFPYAPLPSPSSPSIYLSHDLK